MKVILATSFALVAFAFNSILCRMALGTDEIDAASFTAIRLLSGAVTLPILTGSNNMPIGVQLVGRRFYDGRLLRTAEWLLKWLREQGTDAGAVMGDVA